MTSAVNDSDDLNVRVNHTIGAAPAFGRRGGGRRGPRNNVTVGFHYRGATSSITNPFPSVGGSTSVRSYDVPLGYIRSIGKLTNSLRFDFNRSRTRTQNLYAFDTDVDSAVGISGVSTNPFDWGLPTLSFTNFASMQDTNPQLLRNQTYTFSDYVVWTHGKHSWRWGGDFRRIQLNTETSSNARGTFIFTGYNTSELTAGAPGQSAQQVLGTGYDFADFLLGYPQQTSLQFGQNNYHFHGNYWDLYLQDEWKVRGNLTLNLGVRYEYVSPLTEENNLIANLDLSSSVLNPALSAAPAVAEVLPGQMGPYSGALPASLVRPDRNNFAPRIGFAWKPFSKTVVRGGYGINYNTGAYQGIAQQLAFQPPFSTAATNIQPLVTTFADGGISFPGEWIPSIALQWHHKHVCGESQLPVGLRANSQSGYSATDSSDVVAEYRLHGHQGNRTSTFWKHPTARWRNRMEINSFRFGFPMCRRLTMRTRWLIPKPTRLRCDCGNGWPAVSQSEEFIRFPSQSTMRLRSAQALPPGREAPGSEPVEPAPRVVSQPPRRKRRQQCRTESFQSFRRARAFQL